MHDRHKPRRKDRSDNNTERECKKAQVPMLPAKKMNRKCWSCSCGLSKNMLEGPEDDFRR